MPKSAAIRGFGARVTWPMPGCVPELWVACKSSQFEPPGTPLTETSGATRQPFRGGTGVWAPCLRPKGSRMGLSGTRGSPRNQDNGIVFSTLNSNSKWPEPPLGNPIATIGHSFSHCRRVLDLKNRRPECQYL
jgi:hypothetical protein